VPSQAQHNHSQAASQQHKHKVTMHNASLRLFMNARVSVDTVPAVRCVYAALMFQLHDYAPINRAKALCKLLLQTSSSV
jgi:hypothetical protein